MDYVVAHQMLTRSTSAKAGDTVLLQGAGGGVGTAFMQIARQLGVRVLGTDGETKRAHVEAEGGVLIDFEREDVPMRCKELTQGRGVAYAYDGIGATATSSLRSLRPGGRLVWFGMITLLSHGGRHWRGSASTAWNLARAFTANLLPGGKRTSLYSIQTLARRHPEWYRQDLAALMAMLAQGKLLPRIASVRTLEQVPSGLGNLAGQGPTGKQVIATAITGSLTSASERRSSGTCPEAQSPSNLSAIGLPALCRIRQSPLSCVNVCRAIATPFFGSKAAGSGEAR
jgi:NADPH2:quinone reductase